MGPLCWRAALALASGHRLREGGPFLGQLLDTGGCTRWVFVCECVGLCVFPEGSTISWPKKVKEQFDLSCQCFHFSFW